MKKLLLVVFSSVFLFGCTSSDDDSASNNSFNPPSWIQGRWLEESKTFGYKFSTNNVCLISSSTDACFKESMDVYNGTQIITSVNEEIKSDTEYKFSYTIQSMTQYFHFVKVSNTEIKDEKNDPNGYNLYTKQ